MHVLVPIILTSFAYVSISVLAVGYVLYLTVSRKWDSGPYGRSVSFILAQSAALGILYNFYQFLVVLAVSQHVEINRQIVAYAKFAMDAAVIGMVCVHGRKYVIPSFHTIKNASQPVDWVIMGAGFLLGLFAMLKFPVVMDCSQFGVTVDFWHGNSGPIMAKTGAFGFSSLVYFNSLLAGDAAIANAASGLKPFLGFLFALATLAVVEGFGFETNRTGNKILLFLIFATSFVFYVGVIQYGKASIFAVVLSVFFIAALLKEECLDYPVAPSLFMAASVVLGVITVPYLFLITVMIVVAHMDIAKTYRFVKTVIIVAGPPLCVVVSTNLDVSPLPIAAAFAAVYLLNYLGRGQALPMLRLPLGARYLPGLLLIVMLILCHMLMPLKLPRVYETSLGGLPIVSFHSPVDGKTTFSEYLFTFSDSTLAVVLTLIGVGLVLSCRRFEHRLGLKVFALFPFVGTAAVLILGHSGQTALSNSDLWNLIKDIPNWYGGIITGLFALVSVNAAGSLIVRSGFLRTVVWWCCGIIVAIGVLTSVSPRKTIAYALDFSLHTEGGIAHFDKEMLRIVQHLPGPQGTHGVAVFFKRPEVWAYMYQFRVFGARRVVPLCDTEVGKQLNNLLRYQPILLLFDRAHLMDVLEAAGKENIILERLETFPETGDSLCRLRRSGYPEHVTRARNGLDMKMADVQDNAEAEMSRRTVVVDSPAELPSVFVQDPKGLHGIERHTFGNPRYMEPIDFRWAERSIDVAVYLTGPCKVSFDIRLIPRDANPNVITLRLDGAVIQTARLSEPDGRFIKAVHISRDLQSGIHHLRLESEAPAGFFPNDGRPIAFGLVVPVRCRIEPAAPQTSPVQSSAGSHSQAATRVRM